MEPFRPNSPWHSTTLRVRRKHHLPPLLAEVLCRSSATYSTHGRFSEQLLDMVDYGRRFTLGIHFRY
jgi:hypothetical protein